MTEKYVIFNKDRFETTLHCFKSDHPAKTYSELYQARVYDASEMETLKKETEGTTILSIMSYKDAVLVSGIEEETDAELAAMFREIRKYYEPILTIKQVSGNTPSLMKIHDIQINCGSWKELIQGFKQGVVK